MEQNVTFFKNKSHKKVDIPCGSRDAGHCKNVTTKIEKRHFLQKRINGKLIMNNYSKADTTHVYYYTLGSMTDGTEYRAANKQDLEKAIEDGNVTTFRIETNEFYCLNKEGRSNG